MKFYPCEKEGQKSFGFAIFPLHSPPPLLLLPVINYQSLMVVYDIIKKL